MQHFTKNKIEYIWSKSHVMKDEVLCRLFIENENVTYFRLVFHFFCHNCEKCHHCMSFMLHRELH